MRKLLLSASSLLILLMGACNSNVTSVKQLDEASAKRMVADRLSAKQYEIFLNQVFAYLVSPHSKDDYRTGNVGPYGPGLKQLLEQGFISQSVHTTAYPEVSGTFIRGCNEGWSDEWILSAVQGTNELHGQSVLKGDNGAFTYPGSGSIEANGTFNLSCTGNGMTTCDDQGAGQYYEDAGKGYLKFRQYARAQCDAPYVGPATGRKLTATWYAYALTPKFEGLIQHGPAGPYILGGKIQVGEITNLRLNTDTQASASFAWSASLNDLGKMVSIGGPPNGVGQVTFGKKPDQSWVIDSVSGVDQ